ncbi:MAG: hypothetical protein KDD56_06135 [Bdellovibrionales bacterium]|nr:hypothetical protein [Bdellovibrionales bacterium]
MQEEVPKNISETELHERARTGAKIDLRIELQRLERMIEDLAVDYEKFFMQILPFAPEKPRKAVELLIRQLLKAPFHNSATKYKLTSLRSRYQMFRTKWERIERQREEGIYIKDVFKADIRERNRFEDEKSQTTEGKTSKSMQALFNSYKTALEKSTGKAANLNYEKFKKQLLDRAKAFRKTNGDKKMKFTIKEKNGRVTVAIKAG